MFVPGSPQNYDEWRQQALCCLHRNLAPEMVLWYSDGNKQGSLFNHQPDATLGPKVLPDKQQLKIPAEFVSLAKAVACHHDPNKWDLLYRILWRLVKGGEKNLMKNQLDNDVYTLRKRAKNISRDVHKMHAFVRFRKVSQDSDSGREQFIAWFEPEHKIAIYAAGFFVKRFTQMNWSIITPEESICWNGSSLLTGPGGKQADVPEEDAQEALWLAYYQSIFNPARLKLKAMQAEMPKKYWNNLPEAQLIDSLIHGAHGRTQKMLLQSGKAPSTKPLKRIEELGEKTDGHI